MNPGWYGKNFQYCRGFPLISYFFSRLEKLGLTLIFGKHILMVEKNDRQESIDGGEPNGRQ